MIDGRIGEVRVRVRTDIPEAAEIRPAVERTVRAALERCAELLEERAPGRIVLIRRLPLHWRFEEDMLGDPLQVEDLALAAADAIERMAAPPRLEPPENANVAVVFEDESHWRASHLLACARARPAWFYESLNHGSDPLAALAAPERREIAEAVLVRLARAGVLAEVLAKHAPPAVATLAKVLGCDTEPSTLLSVDRVIVSRLVTIASQWPALTCRTIADNPCTCRRAAGNRGPYT